MTETVAISSLTFDPKNSRKHSKKNLDAIKGSLKRFGQQKPIVVSTEDGTVIAGNGTLQAAKELGWKEIQVIRSDLEGSEAKAYAIADNRSGELAEWEDAQLSETLKKLQEEKFDLDSIGFSDSDLKKLIAQELKPGLCDDDEVPEVSETRCKAGDLWILGEHRLLCGDSTNVQHVERLMGREKADMVFTDPPYGYKYESNHQSKYKMLENDDKILDFMPVAFASMENNSCIYVCGSHQTIEIWKPLFAQHFEYKNLIVWKKNNWSMGDLKGSFAGQHELILFGHKGKVALEGKRDTDVWEFNREPPKDHPTQKPVDLISFAISKVLSNRILDLFLGSGSTLIACEKTHRKCFGMEIDPHYCDVILARWEKFTGKTATLTAGL